MAQKSNLSLVKKGTLKRLMKTLFSFFPVLLPFVVFLILLNAIISAQASGPIFKNLMILIVFYVISLVAAFLYQRLMAVITQGSLAKFREQAFKRMESLPIRYFDTHAHGDIMSVYTNDIDALRQMISQSFPQLFSTFVVLVTLAGVMIYYSINMFIMIIIGVILMAIVTKILGGKSTKYLVKQQVTLGETEGYIEEMMNGQKVVKVFNHEKEAIADFDKVNENWFEASRKANMYSNILGPILHNMSNILYVIAAITGGVLLLWHVPNISISGMAISISIVVPFLNMTKQFTGSIGQVSQQINAVVMGLAGAARIFELMDQEPEVDEGYVTLVRAKEVNGEIVETTERTGMWAWKHPHQDGTLSYTKLAGDVELEDVDFSYNPNKQILNLINRFYDIQKGKIRYDGINIDKIKKDDLRRSLGIVLQDTNLFTGTVMDNIRYGYLDATDEECIGAAKLVGAHDFITRLPEGYNTPLRNNGSNLSQGQRQLIAIARAAVADPPVMIMDEATSSIDTRTEAIVQRGMDALMHGRTVFVIAHRLSTVQNSDVIMVLDHGHIIERGSHNDLIAKKGQYYQLYTGAFELE